MNRQFERRDVEIPVIVHPSDEVDASAPGEILNISMGGAFVHCLAPVRIGQELHLSIHFDGYPQVTEKVVICWARGSSKSGVGVRFLERTPATQEYLNKLFEPKPAGY